MFDQTFVREDASVRKPASVLVSFSLQCLAVAAAVLFSIAYSQGLPSAQLRALVVAPRPPVAQRPLPHVAKEVSPAKRSAHRVFVYADPGVPIPRATRSRQLDQAPPESYINGVGSSAGDTRMTDLFVATLNDYGTEFPSPPPTKPAVSKTQLGPERVSKGVAAANLIFQVKPAYPPLAISTHTQGTVRFRAIISKQGRIEDLTLVSGHPLLVEAARQAVLLWRYRPTLLNGEPVNVITDIDVNFQLSQ